MVSITPVNSNLQQLMGVVLRSRFFSLDDAFNLCSISIKKADPFGAAFLVIVLKNYFFLEALILD